MNFVYGPMTSWSVDLIPSLTKTDKGHSAIFLAVDMKTKHHCQNFLQPINQKIICCVVAKDIQK
jgi:hypothetical protein